MLTLKRLVSSVVFVGIGLSGLLMAADTRLLVVSIQLPPQEVVDSLSVNGLAQKGKDKINGWGDMHPQKFAKKMIKGLMPSDILPKSTSGIMGIYGGYSGYSDHMGCLTFPLRHTDPQVDVIFTPSIDLERLYKETYSGIFISQKSLTDAGIADSMAPSHYIYSLQTTPTVAGDGKAAAPAPAAEPSEKWVVTKSGVSIDTRLPTNAVIILVNPRNIFVPVGNFPTSSKPHLVLPDAFMIGKKFNDAVLLNNQKNMKYFEEIVIADSTVVNKNVQIHQSAVVND